MSSVKKGSGVTSDNISIAQKVAFLENKDSYPQQTGGVEVVKTHMSWVFLTDHFVYKLKIPFRYDHMRLLTPEARRQNCLDEVRLNNRLAEDFYLGVVPLSVDKEGGLVLGKSHRVIDWLVKMKRLPAEMMLDHWIKTGREISETQLEPAAELLTEFYIQSDPIAMSINRFRQTLKQYIKEYHKELKSQEFNLPADRLDIIFKKQSNFIDKNIQLFKRRIEKGKIIEGHGDLKPDHICLSPAAVIDCLEFDRQLRILDVFDDLAFLSLECERFGAQAVGEYFINYYGQTADDSPPVNLVNFYKSYKAVIRSLLSIRHLREEQYQGDPKWRKRSLMYLGLSEKYLDIMGM